LKREFHSTDSGKEKKSRGAGRPSGSSPKSQLKILQVLVEKPKSYGQIVNETDLHRNTVANNLKTLVSIGAVYRDKTKRQAIYRINPFDVIPFFMDHLRSEGNLKFKREERKIAVILRARNGYKKILGRVAEFLVKYSPELTELGIADTPTDPEDPVRGLWFAAERRRIDCEKTVMMTGSPTSSTRNPVDIVREQGSHLWLSDLILPPLIDFLKHALKSPNITVKGMTSDIESAVKIREAANIMVMACSMRSYHTFKPSEEMFYRLGKAVFPHLRSGLEPGQKMDQETFSRLVGESRELRELILEIIYTKLVPDTNRQLIQWLSRIWNDPPEC
jgi:hypothetical protein